MALQFTISKGGMTSAVAYAKIVQYAGNEGYIEIKVRIWASQEARLSAPEDFLVEQLYAISFAPTRVFDPVTQEWVVAEPIIKDPDGLFTWLYFKLKQKDYFKDALDV